MRRVFEAIKVTEGNAFSIVVPLKKRTFISERPIDEDIDVFTLENLHVFFGGIEYTPILTAGGVCISLPATLQVRSYSLLLTATYQGAGVRVAYETAVIIVPYSEQSDAQNYLPGSPIVLDAAYIIGGAMTDEELEQLKDDLRQAIADENAAKEAYDEARQAYIEKAEQLDNVAQESTSQEILQLVSGVGRAAAAYNVGKTELAENLTEKGVPASASEELPTLADKVLDIQNVEKVFSVSDMSQGWLGIPGTLELIAQYYDVRYPYAQAYILTNGTQVTTVAGCKRIVYSDGGNVATVDNPSGNYIVGAYNDTVTIGFAVLMFDEPEMQNAPISNNYYIFEFGCKGATIEFGGMNGAYVRLCRFSECDIILQAGCLQQSRICLFVINSCTMQTISGSYTFQSCTQLQSISLPQVSTISGSYTFYGCTNLIDVEIGAAMQNSFTLATWNPTNVLSDAAKKAQMLANIRNHIAANLPDKTGETALTITFHANVKAAIQADQATSDAFTNKNWTIA